mgnify:CR=1 FL=1
MNIINHEIETDFSSHSDGNLVFSKNFRARFLVHLKPGRTAVHIFESVNMQGGESVGSEEMGRSILENLK